MTSHSLNKLLKKGALDKLKLNDDKLAYFNFCIDAIYSLLVLALLKPDLPYFVDTVASKYGLGYTLFQTYDGGER